MQGEPEIMTGVSLRDSEIEYCERGAGEPLLLVHAGVFANWFVPMAASRVLEGFRVIRVRRAGYGRNAPSARSRCRTMRITSLGWLVTLV